MEATPLQFHNMHSMTVNDFWLCDSGATQMKYFMA